MCPHVTPHVLTSPHHSHSSSSSPYKGKSLSICWVSSPPGQLWGSRGVPRRASPSRGVGGGGGSLCPCWFHLGMKWVKWECGTKPSVKSVWGFLQVISVLVSLVLEAPAGPYGPGCSSPGGSCRSSRSWPPLHVLTALVTPAGRCAPGGSYGRCGPGGSSCWSVFLEALSGRCGPCLSEASRRLCAHMGAGHEEEEEGGRAEQRGCGTGAGSSQHPQKRQTDRQTDESRRRLS